MPENRHQSPVAPCGGKTKGMGRAARPVGHNLQRRYPDTITMQMRLHLPAT